MKYIAKIALFLMLMVTFISCERTVDFPDEPYLEWRDAIYSFDEDTTSNRRNFELQAYFTDGDGDIGLIDGTPYDTCSFEDYNFQIKYFEKVGGSFIEIQPQDSCLSFSNMIPDITPEGQNKALEGVIKSKFEYSFYPENSSADSIKFEVRLRDRAGNLSSWVMSPAIVSPPL